MIRIRLHTPDFIETDPDERSEYDANDQASLFAQEPFRSLGLSTEFKHWSLAGNLLMLESSKEYYVFGAVIEGLDLLTLPAWRRSD